MKIKVHVRAFTLIELLICVTMLLIVGIAAMMIYYHSGITPDMSDVAKAWGEKMEYKVEKASCTKSTDDGFSSCSLRIAGRNDLLPIECAIISHDCRLMKAIIVH